MSSTVNVSVRSPILELALAAARVDLFDAAILNLVIEGKNAYAVAEIVAERGLPFAFASGVPRSSIDLEWRDRPYLAKPYVMEDIRRWLESLRPSGESRGWTCGVSRGCASAATALSNRESVTSDGDSPLGKCGSRWLPHPYALWNDGCRHCRAPVRS